MYALNTQYGIVRGCSMEIKAMDNIKKNIDEIKETYEKCRDLFDEAWIINIKREDPFVQKVTTYIPDIMQTLGAIIAEIEQ